MLALTFADPGDYDSIDEDDRISVLGLADLAPGRPVQVQVAKPDGTTLDITAEHTLSYAQIEWFQAGSALNRLPSRHGHPLLLLAVDLQPWTSASSTPCWP